MTGTTHLLCGASAGIAFSLFTSSPVGTATLIVLAAGTGSLLPDIDTATSKLGQKTAPVSWVIRILFGHRQMFHSATFWALPILALLYLFPGASTLVMAGAIGVITHLLLDSLNPAGVPLLWPLPKRFVFGSCRCRGFFDLLLALAFAATTVLLLLLYFRSVI